MFAIIAENEEDSDSVNNEEFGLFRVSCPFCMRLEMNDDIGGNNCNINT